MSQNKIQQKVQRLLKDLIPTKTEVLVKERVLHGYALLRSTHFTLQQLSLPWFEYVATGRTPPSAADYQEKYREILPALNAMLQRDARDIAEGYLPVEVLKPENFVKHSLRFPQIIKDGYALSLRRKNKKSHEFSAEAQEFLEDLPEYYRRNFHFQTDGYLSEASAELYEHQVEILFAGSADAMRRALIPQLKRMIEDRGHRFEHWKSDGEGLRFLEVGAGTGRLTRFMKMAFPKAEIVVLDISAPYLRRASEHLAGFEGLEFDLGLAEKLSYSDESFDFVYSCFLFHELPLEIRKQVLKEGFRVLKSGGVYGLVDSLQLNDETFQWALEQFPQDFHEPFYRNYTQHAMEGLLDEAGFNDVQSQTNFLSKSLLAIK